MAAKQQALAQPTNILKYIGLGSTMTGAVAVLIPEFKKKKPSVAVIDSQAQMVLMAINGAFGTKVKPETVSRCVSAVMAVLAEAK
jgi:hypothetical protein